MRNDLIGLMSARRGHFKLESGHHGALWLDLDGLFLHPSRLRPFMAELGAKLGVYRIDGVCGPLSGGAFVAQAIAAEMGLEFYHTERAGPRSDALYGTQYRLPEALRSRVSGKRLAIVDDVINAGSAVRATLAEVAGLGAVPIAIAALLVLGTTAERFAATQSLPLVSIASLSNEIWEPSECPLCAAVVPFD
ncbi:MAG: hypothetical protein JO273_22065 [Methylobacteriaceae bacterium]|nr:hypothetical protein [Methylobacteriaceae bacterium]